VVFGSKKVAVSSHLAHPEQAGAGAYDGLIVEIAKFSQTRKPPVSPAESAEVLAFMEAADRSELQHGAEVPLEPVQ
jgi:hypothetical protein